MNSAVEFGEKINGLGRRGNKFNTIHIVFCRFDLHLLLHVEIGADAAADNQQIGDIYGSII